MKQNKPPQRRKKSDAAKSVRKGLSPNPFSASLSHPSKPSHPMTETPPIKEASLVPSTTKTQKMQRQPVSTKCVADGMSDASPSVVAVKEHLKTTISTLLLKRTAAEYGCTPTHLKRVLLKSKQSSKLLLWLTDNHPELLTAKTNAECGINREERQMVR